MTFECPDCQDSGTTALYDVRGTMIDASYCSCGYGERLRAEHDRQAAQRIAETNAHLGFISWAALKAVRAGLLALDGETA